MPLRPGILMSRIMAANSWRSIASSASSADCARTSAQPLDSSITSRASRFRASSSTMRILTTSSAMQSGLLPFAIFVTFALSIKPDAQQRQQLVGVHRLGDVVGGAGLQTLLTIALHGLGGQRENR